MLMAHDVMGMINGTAGVPSRKVCGFDRDRDKGTDGFNPPAASFDRNIGDIELERCRSGRSCCGCMRGGACKCVLDRRVVRTGGVFNWTQRNNYHKSSLGPHVYDSGISHFI